MSKEKTEGLRARKDRVRGVSSKRKAQLQRIPGGTGDRESRGLPDTEGTVPISESEFLHMAARFEQKLKHYGLLFGNIPSLLIQAHQALVDRKFPVAADYYNLVRDYVSKNLQNMSPDFDPVRDLDPFIPGLQKLGQD
jgi:hypothetical protein